MVQSDLGRWEPLPLESVAELLGAAPFRWWISGGTALELFLGRSWREHDDIDVGIVRYQAGQAYRYLHGWDLHVAARGRLARWHGELLDPDLDQNNIWCRKVPTDPWALDITVGSGSAEEWIYRRDPLVRVPWSQAVLTTSTGVLYLAPELQLLFKSTNRRAKDDLDAAHVIPELEPERQRQLAELLGPDHPWRRHAG